MKKIWEKYNLIIFFAIFSFLPLTWCSWDMIIAGGDDNPFLNPASVFKFTTWDNGAYAFNFNNFLSRIFPLGFFWWFWEKLGVALPIIEKMWFWHMWFVSLLGLAYLAKTLFPENYKKISFFGGIFYAINPFTTFIPLTISIIYTHTFLPWILAFFINGIEATSNRKRIFYAILFGLANLGAAPVFGSPPNAVALFILPLAYFIFSLYRDGLHFLKNKIIFSLYASIFFLALNIYHLWSVIYIWFFGNSAEIVASLGGQIFPTSSLFDVFRTLGGWAFGLDPSKPYEAMFYNNFAIVFFSYLLVIIAFSSVLYIKKNKSVLFLFLSVVALLFLVKGTLSPLGGIYKYLFDNFNFFKGFREPWTKFSPPYVLTLSLLFGYSCWKLVGLANLKNKIWSGAAALAILIALFCFGLPAFNGTNIFDRDLPGQRSTKIKIPQYWNDFALWAGKNNRGAVLVTPKNLSARDYDWESGISSLIPLEYLSIRNPIRYSNYLVNFGIPDYDGFFSFFGDINKIKSDNFYNFLKMTGVKYVVQENDIFWEMTGSGIYSPEAMKEALSDNSFLKKVNSFGQIDVYQFEGDGNNPLIYPSEKIIISNGPAYAFSSWNKKEEENFSFIEKKDLNFDTSRLDIARQVFSKDMDGKDNDAQKTITLDVDRSGSYTAYLNLQDAGKIDQISLDGNFNESPWQSQTVDIDRNPIFKKTLDIIGYNQVFYDVNLGNISLDSGKNAYKFKSKDIAKNNFKYLVLNQYFEGNGGKNNLPEMEIKNYSDTGYLLNIKKNSSPYILNLAVNFDKNWELYLVKNEKTLLDAPHFKINAGTGNSWYIDPKNLGLEDDYQLSVEYKPQKYLNFFLLVSLASLAIGLTIILKLRNIFYE